VELDAGVIVAAVAAVLFYLRLIRAQRSILRSGADGSAAPPQGEAPRLVRRWGLFWLGMALVVAGAFAAAGSFSAVAAALRAWWWVPVSAGFGVLALSI
jgi:hypothetical protein